MKAEATQDARTSAPVRSADLSAVAYEWIEELFVSMRLAPGAFLRTQDIQALVGIGRTPVHQAIRRLSAETLLEIRPRNGLRVAPIDLARERHLAVLRRDLMRFVTEAAMRNLSSNDRVRIHDLRRRLTDDPEAMDVDRFNEIDKAFDILLIQASGERFLDRTLRPLHAIARRTGYLHLTQLSGANGLARTVERHLVIMEGVVSGAAGTVRAACDDLVAYAVELIDDLEARIDPRLLDVNYPALRASSTPGT
ncbi:GntR family transcriptional regulator [uncultured Jannaschia sp.]|uniref:GntR family transcriptional regulator n=1 Tax=uncultured Jannaschia sp. TaxID=293347 RepID=UPI00261AC7A3|nr:GntR family transcriptional regulator [uncultured Jannaschia sp.]